MAAAPAGSCLLGSILAAWHRHSHSLFSFPTVGLGERTHHLVPRRQQIEGAIGLTGVAEEAEDDAGTEGGTPEGAVVGGAVLPWEEEEACAG